MFLGLIAEPGFGSRHVVCATCPRRIEDGAMLLLEPAGVEDVLIPLALEDVIYDSDIPGCSRDLKSVSIDGENTFVVVGQSPDDTFG